MAALQRLVRQSLTALFLLLLFAISAQAQVDTKAVAETPLRFYQAVNGKDYAMAWSLLTEASKVRMSELVAEDLECSPAQARTWLDANDPKVLEAFWETFRNGAKSEIYAQLVYKYSGEKDGVHTVEVSAAQPGGQTMEMLVKDEGGFKFGLAETYEI